jgi:hypothetical protein
MFHHDIARPVDRDEKVLFLPEAIRERLMADDLHGGRLDAAPMCRSITDDFGRRRVGRRQLTGDQFRLRGHCPGRASVLV